MSKYLDAFFSIALTIPFFLFALITPAFAVPGSPADPGALPNPEINIAEKTQTTITIAWEAIEGADHYAIFITDPDGTENFFDKTDLDKLEWEFKSLQPGKNYPIVLKACVGQDCSSGDEISVKTNGVAPAGAPANAGNGAAADAGTVTKDGGPAGAAGATTALGGGPAGVLEVQQLIQRMINLIVPAAFLILTVILFWAGIKFLTSGGDAKAISTASLVVTWALLGILFLILAWLILNLVGAFTGIESITKFCLGFPGAKTGCDYN